MLGEQRHRTGTELRGVVDEDIDAAEALDRSLRNDFRDFGDVAWNGENSRVWSELLFRAAKRFLAAGVDDEWMTAPRELPRQSEAQAFRCTSDEHNIISVHAHMIGSKPQRGFVRKGCQRPVHPYRDE